MTELFLVLRVLNVGLCVAVAALSAVALGRNYFPPGAPYLRFLRVGQIELLLVTAYASVTAIVQHRPPSTTAPLITSAVLLSLVGTVWTIAVERRRRPHSS